MTASRTNGARTTLPSDPVSRYAQRVLAGRIVAGRAVRLAAERHQRDYARQRTKDFPYWFSPAAAKHIIDFFPQFIRLEDSVTPMVLASWAQFALGSIFGWRRVVDDGRRYQHAYIETAKGSGKTPYLAGVGLYCLAFDGEQSGEVYVAGFDRGQAEILLRDAIRMARDSPDLSAMLDIGKYNLAHLESGSFMRAVSSEHRSKSGPRPSCVLIDEEHEHRDGTVIAKMGAGFKSRVQPLMLRITNAGFDRTSVCWQDREQSLSVLNQTITDKQWFAYVCQLDPCEPCRLDGYTQPREGCPDCDDWTDSACWEKTNPSLPIGLPRREYLQAQVEKAQSMPSEQALVRRLNFCTWSQAHTTWIPADQWAACQAPVMRTVERARVIARGDPAPMIGRCALALDLSSKLDLTSACAATAIDDEPGVMAAAPIELESVGPEGRIERRVLNLNFSVEFVTWFWMPGETLLERVRTERIPYDVWERAGHLRVTAGGVVDYDELYRTIVDEIAPQYGPSEIAYDPWNATQFAVQLRDRGRFSIVEAPQGRKLSEAFKLFEALVRSGRALHDGNPVMAWCVGNAEPKRDRHENLWVEKADKLKRIDGLIAAVMALWRLMMNTSPEPNYQMLIIGGSKA